VAWALAHGTASNPGPQPGPLSGAAAPVERGMEVAARPRPQRSERNSDACRLARCSYAVDKSGAAFRPNPLGVNHPIRVIPDTTIAATWRKPEETTLRAEFTVDKATHALAHVTIGRGATAQTWWTAQLYLHHLSNTDDARDVPGHYGSMATLSRWSWGEEPAAGADNDEFGVWPSAFTITSVQRKLVVTLAADKEQVRRALVAGGRAGRQAGMRRLMGPTCEHRPAPPSPPLPTPSRT
jgi:hypothetical protein